jgi:type II secretory pathway component PulF
MNLDDITYKYAKFTFNGNLKQQLRLYRKLAGMLNMNESLPRALERLWITASFNGKKPNDPQAIALKEWRQALQAGRSLTDAMGGWVPERHIMILRSGEESGAIAKGMQAIEFIEKATARMRGAISNAIGYPVFIFLVMFAVLWMFGVNLVSPMREFAPESVKEKIAGLGMVTDFVQNYGIGILLIIAVIAGIIVYSLPRWTGKLRAKFDKYPPYSWYRIWNGSAFLMSISALLGAQTPLSRALSILESRATPWLKERIFSARQEVMRGKNLGEALQADELGFPDETIVFDMIILAERADVATVLDMVSREWLDEQILMLEAQSGVVRSAGMMLMGGVIAWAFMSIIGIAQGTAEMGSSANNIK